METKRCSKCGKEKELDKFPIYNRNNKCHLKSYCKECAVKMTKEWRNANPERVKELKNKWYKENPEKVREMKNKWVSDNREKSRAIKHKWERANIEKVKIKNEKWKRDNPDKVNAARKKRRLKCVDSYIRDILIEHGFPKDQITPEIIELKRMIIKTKRKIKDECKHN